jgi:hypothetical protein
MAAMKLNLLAYLILEVQALFLLIGLDVLFSALHAGDSISTVLIVCAPRGLVDCVCPEYGAAHPREVLERLFLGSTTLLAKPCPATDINLIRLGPGKGSEKW